ncbi:hypothetical protein B0O99DRAFT_493098, partial [Bisporella sp. PMI_857]
IRKGILGDFWFRKEGWNVEESILDSWVKEADRMVAELEESFPKGAPYVFTHRDLDDDNIFISNENEEKKFKVSAIIDWELSGFFPWWAES